MGNFAENLNLGNRFRPPLGDLIYSNICVLYRYFICFKLSMSLAIA